MAASLPQTMNASLAVVQASGAPCLELPTPKAGARVHFGGAVQELSPMHCSQDGSPMAASTAPASPWSPVTPMVTSSSSFFPAAGSTGLRLCSSRADGSRASFQGLGDMTPKSPAPSPTAASPGAVIRRNADRLGIPLNLEVQGILAPVPVMDGGPGRDQVLVPSPKSGSAPMQVELPEEPAPQQLPVKVPRHIASVARPSAGRFSGA